VPEGDPQVAVKQGWQLKRVCDFRGLHPGLYDLAASRLDTISKYRVSGDEGFKPSNPGVCTLVLTIISIILMHMFR